MAQASVLKRIGRLPDALQALNLAVVLDPPSNLTLCQHALSVRAAESDAERLLFLCRSPTTSESAAATCSTYLLSGAITVFPSA